MVTNSPFPSRGGVYVSIPLIRVSRVTRLSQWDITKCDAIRGLKNAHGELFSLPALGTLRPPREPAQASLLEYKGRLHKGEPSCPSCLPTGWHMSEAILDHNCPLPC